MDKMNYRTNTFQPVFRALTDTFLQMRARPLVYALVWATLSLLPYIVLGLIFSAPLSQNLQSFMEMAENDYTEMLSTSFLKILGLLALTQCLLLLVAVFMNDVLAVSVRKFRSSLLPRYTDVLSEAVPLYVPFLRVVLRVLGLLLLRPLGVLAVSIILGSLMQQQLFFSLGFLGGLFMFLSGIYKYGLAPFIHLSLNLSGVDSCRLSRQYYLENRHIIASLFLIFLVVPFIAVLLLFSVFLQAGLYNGFGGMLLWFIQSAFQFIISMSLINFAMDAFPGNPHFSESSPSRSEDT